MKNRGGTRVDPTLKHRVRQYLKNHKGPYVDLVEMASELQQQFRMEYGRRNRTAFRIQVEMVHAMICSESQTDISALEKEHLAKRARRSTQNGDEGQEMGSSEDSEDEVPEHEPWTIDRTGDKPPENIFIDLCEEESSSSKNNKDSSKEKKELKSKSEHQKRKKSKPEEEEEETRAGKTPRKSRSRGPELQASSVKFEDFGGSEGTLEEVCKLLVHMKHPEVFQRLGVVPPRGFLLHGPPGCGKTLLAQAVAGELDLPMLKVSSPELVSGVSGESEQKLRELFDQAVSSAPCVLFIDEIDAITPKREVASKDMERRIVAQLLSCLDELNAQPDLVRVLVIGATNRPDSLDPALRRAGRFDREISLGIPDEPARVKILKTLCRKLALPEDFDFVQLAHLTPGYVGADLMALCREAAMNAVNRVLLEHPRAEENEITQESEQACELERLLALLKSGEAVSEERLSSLLILHLDFTSALTRVQPSAKREGFATVPDVSWSDVGALLEIREELNMAIMAPIRHPECFQALGLVAPAGLLLAGPPGCGKTLLAKAVANESGLNFISVKGPELLNMYVGESERAVRQVFQRGRNSAPCVIFFDEIDALCPRRSEHESGAGVRVVNQLLTEMDGIENRRQVFVMAATNRPDIIDPAVLRPGRLDKTLYVGLPPAADRHAILLTITKVTSASSEIPRFLFISQRFNTRLKPRECAAAAVCDIITGFSVVVPPIRSDHKPQCHAPLGGTKPCLEADVDLKEIAHDARCDGFTGADLSALVREASVSALRLHLSSTELLKDIRVSRGHFEDAFRKVRPSVSKKVRSQREKGEEARKHLRLLDDVKSSDQRQEIVNQAGEDVSPSDLLLVTRSDDVREAEGVSLQMILRCRQLHHHLLHFYLIKDEKQKSSRAALKDPQNMWLEATMMFSC
ncbi:hypothetical protein DNTS_021770 [Danionella cerebrum]|uniref:AAA+ ATPase domain-containing protein n=1 Tax=Danionella cerebrum TaxID=2873325 RepID=A0A553QNX2_9TELE|nr:hypothetical protein DNTS_021770 [Danionella translucida]